MNANSRVTLRPSVGFVPKFQANIHMTAVLLDGRTKAQFTNAADAEKYAAELRKMVGEKTHG